jgi:hypothetical protein
MGLEAFDRDTLDKAGYVMPGETKNRTVTPYFRYDSLLNEPQSKIQGKPVHDLLEVVELRFAANSQYKPVFLVDEMCEADPDTGRIVTWAERYKPQYQAFLAGSEQEAEGTPLEELLPYGISQAQLSFCRALNIYSIEALAHIEGSGVKKLGIHGNTIKPMAQKYLDDRRNGANQQSEINELKRQLEEMRAAQALSTFIPPADEIPPLPTAHDDLSDIDLKDAIERLVGARPRGNPSRATLVATYEQALAAAQE